MTFVLILGLLLGRDSYSKTAGFAEARQGHSISVSAVPSLRQPTRAALTGWDHLAGWPLFRIGGRPSDVRVTTRNIAGQAGSYAVCRPDFTHPYTHCILVVRVTRFIDPVPVIEHELGHSLGFRDRTDCHQEYRGIMSYCSGGGHLSRADRAMLRRHGYA